MTRFSAITPNEIAEAMKLESWQVWRLAKRLDHHFQPSRKQRVGKKYRLIDPPTASLKKLFRKLHRWLQSLGLAHPSAFGGVKGRSCFRHAQRHLGKKFVWTRDVSNCFPSITPEAVRKSLLDLGFRADTAKLLSMLFTVRDRVPQGSPLSNDALNLFLWDIDQSISSVAGQSKISFGRFCDDSVIASNKLKDGDSAARLLEKRIEDKGLRINTKKKKESGLQRRDSGQRVHNIDVTSKRGTRITREHCRGAAALCERFVRACRAVQPDSLAAIAYQRTRLVGLMHYHRQAKVSLARHIRQQIDAGDRHVQRKLTALRITAERNKWWLKQRGRDEPRRISAVWSKREASQPVKSL